MKAAVISEKGLRPEMEDAHFLDLNFAGKGWAYGGVYDGHGGKMAAEYAAGRVHESFLVKLLDGVTPQQAFVDSYEAVSGELKEQESGTTAVDFLIGDGKIHTANVGDARALVVGKLGVHQFTIDHRLDNSTEKQRIVNMGGRISYPYTYKGMNGLMPTRTLGDEYFKSVGIIATPSVDEYRITSDDLFLIAACDGLFDFMSNEEVAGFSRAYAEPRVLVDALSREVLINRRGTDNLTIIAVALPSEA
ncbi:MAG: PP2C family protein-serine/threonine phosphatase [Chloroflexota bacterium]